MADLHKHSCNTDISCFFGFVIVLRKKAKKQVLPGVKRKERDDTERNRIKRNPCLDLCRSSSSPFRLLNKLHTQHVTHAGKVQS